MGPNPTGHRSVSCDRAIRYSGIGVRSVGPVGDFLDKSMDDSLGCPPTQDAIVTTRIMNHF